jgi:hypothetical protein
MYKIPLCIIAVAGLSSPLLAQSDGDNDADTSCEAQSQDCDDGDRAGQSAKAQVRGWNPERSAAGDGNYIDPDDDGDGIPDAAARGGPKQTGKELKGIPARDGGPDTLPQDSDGDGLGDAASQSAGDPIPDIDITLDQNTTPSKPK